MRRDLLLGIAGLAAGLALYVGYAGWRSVGVELDEARLARVRERAAQLPQLEVGALPQVPDTVGDFVERPLFWAGRRPPEPQDDEPGPEVKVPPAGAPKELEVTGVVNSAGEWFAVAQYKGNPLRLREGDDVGGWQVTRIMADNVVFTGSGREYVLQLFDEIKVESAQARQKTRNTRQPPNRRVPNQRGTARSRALLQRGAQDASEQTATNEAPSGPETGPAVK